jgi:hypothetical protein
MSAFVVRPLSPAIAAEVRTTRRAPQYGHPVHEELARGTGPCRECLRAFEVGAESRLLFTHNAFAGTASLAQPGPVFIHADACMPHAGDGYPDGLRDLPIVAQSYGDDGTIGAPSALPHGEQDTMLATMFDDARTAFVHLRHAEAGCFVARVERATR